MKSLLTFAAGCLAGACAYAAYQTAVLDAEIERLEHMDWSAEQEADWDGEDPLPENLFLPVTGSAPPHFDVYMSHNAPSGIVQAVTDAVANALARRQDGLLN